MPERIISLTLCDRYSAEITRLPTDLGETLLTYAKEIYREPRRPIWCRSEGKLSGLASHMQMPPPTLSKLAHSNRLNQGSSQSQA
jgi:hypothetical protein